MPVGPPVRRDFRSGVQKKVLGGAINACLPPIRVPDKVWLGLFAAPLGPPERPKTLTKPCVGGRMHSKSGVGGVV